MSKATIQMCMSTTGFGPQALRALPQAQQYHPHTSSHSPTTTYTSAPEADTRSDTEMQGYGSRNTGYYSHQSRRPAPRFDMNLKDLFSDDETDKRSFSRVSNQVNAMRPPPPPIKPEPQMQPYTADLKISPQLRNPHHHQPQHQQQQQQQQQQQNFFNPSPNIPSPNAYSTTPALSPPISQSPPQPLPSPYQLTNQLPYSSFAQNITSTYPDLGGFSDLDFLDSFPVQGSANGGGAGADASANAMQDVGIGFGMGFGDGTHDWSDGNGFDLFDGFFFGPGGTGM